MGPAAVPEDLQKFGVQLFIYPITPHFEQNIA
jgi:hypothetical protein